MNKEGNVSNSNNNTFSARPQGLAGGPHGNLPVIQEGFGLLLEQDTLQPVNAPQADAPNDQRPPQIDPEADTMAEPAPTDLMAAGDQTTFDLSVPNTHPDPASEPFNESFYLLQGAATPSSKFCTRPISPLKRYMGFITEKSISLIYAKTGVGKSLLVLCLAFAFTRKDYKEIVIGPWGITTPGGVLLFDGEMINQDLQKRSIGYAKGYGPEDSVNQLIIVTTDDLVARGENLPNLADEGWRNGITQYVRHNPHIKIIALDNISSLAPGINENTKHDWDPINQWLLSLRRMGLAVLLIHHAGKSGTDRGHSGRLDNLDNVIALQKEDSDNGNLRFTLKFEKARSLEASERKPITLELCKGTGGGFTLQQVASKLVQEEMTKTILKMLAEKVTQKRISEKVGIGQPRVSQIRQTLINSGYLSPESTLTDSGQAWIAD